MNEREVMHHSIYVFLLGCVIFVIIGLIEHKISYLLGYILGYLINLLSTNIIMFSLRDLRPGKLRLPYLFYALRMILYGLGFYLAIVLKPIHVVGVFFGYLILKITICIDTYRHRKG